MHPVTSDASLWRHADFLKLWASETVSQVGAQITFLALPLTAVVMLDATPGQMGLLTAMSSLPPLVVGLHSGAVIDRRERRPIMIASDAGRAILLGCVPLAWVTNTLSIELLYIIAFLIATLTLVSSIAHQAFLPILVARQRLVDANSKMALTSTAAEVAGPTLAGGLVQVFSAPLALTANACTYLVSALLLSRIRVTEPVAGASPHRHGIWRGIRLGLRVALKESRLRALIWSRSLLNFFNAMLETVFVLYVVRELGIGAGMIGIIFSIGSIGFLIGALLSVRLAHRIGVGPSMVAGVAVVALSDLAVPFAGGTHLVVVGVLVAAQFFFGLGLTVFNVHQASLRQALVPADYLGRVGASIRVMGDGLTPLGAVLGGTLGAAFGLRETLILAAAGELLAAVWLWYSPVRQVQELPSSASTLAEAP